MAKRRKFGGFKRRAKKSYGFKRGRKSGRKKTGFGGGSMMGAMLGAAAYGALREKVSNYLSPYTSKIPLGVASDEAGMLALNWAIATGKIPVLNRVPMLRDVGKAGVYIESARIGQMLADGSLLASFKTTQTQSSSSNGLLF